jgi:predicted RNA-binding Zn ribbon-like protein
LRIVEPVFLGGHPAIDFLNTAFAPDGRLVETIGDGPGFLNWLAGAGLVQEAGAARVRRRLGSRSLDSAATEARKLREWARAWLERWRLSPAGDYAAEISRLNELLGREACHHEVILTKQGLRVLEREQLDSVDALLALVARSIAALVTEEDASLIKHCAGSGCTLWFLDRTKRHGRRFCSAAACGNRAKVAAFRERLRK